MCNVTKIFNESVLLNRIDSNRKYILHLCQKLDCINSDNY